MKRILLFNKNGRYLKVALALLFTVFTLSNSFAQGKRITGTISDNSGPVPGASVMIKGTTTGVT
ncbi:MAG: hypothetical protein ABIN95_07845, partial [Mucilaginibacter sp.]